MNQYLNLTQKIMRGYTELCKPLCRELNLPQTAFDILMFLANNPEYKTASDIVDIRHLKSNLVSVNVERLVQENYLRREPTPEDRRKIHLYCTDKAQPVIRRGRELQNSFFAALFTGTDAQMRSVFNEVLATMDHNLNQMMEGY